MKATSPPALLLSNRLSLGVVMMLGAMFLFVTLDTTAKLLVSAGIPALQVAFMRYLSHSAWVLVAYAPAHGRRLLRSRNWRLQLLRGLCIGVATVLNFTALKHLPLTLTISIFFATPLVVCLLSIPVLGERVGVRRFTAIGVGFIGVLIIVRPFGAAFSPYALLSLGALLCAATYFVLSRKVAGADSNAVAQFFTAGVATVLLAPFMVLGWQWPDGIAQWSLILLTGTLGFFGHSLVSSAHHYAEASVLAPTVYTQAVYATIYSWVLFSTAPDMPTLIGTVIVIGSGLYVWLRERRLENRAD